MASAAFSAITDEVSAQQFNSEQDLVHGEIELDGKLFPIVGDVSVSNLALWDPKFVVGDPKINDDKYFSVWNVTNLTGGSLVEVLNASSDINRYRHGTLAAEWPDQLSLPLETVSYDPETPDGDDAYVLGDYDDGFGTKVYGASGTKLHHYDAMTDAWIEDDDLTAEPFGQQKGTAYDGTFLIPLGSSGYDAWDGAAITNYPASDTSPGAVAFCEWDNRLVALDTNNQIWATWDGTTWLKYPDMVIKVKRTPRNLVLWWTPERKLALYVVTSRDVWVCDFLAQVLYRTGLRFPIHPDFGLGSTSWQDDAMYVSVGLGVHQLSLGGVIDSVGLDRGGSAAKTNGDGTNAGRGGGLPAYLRGRITDLEPEYNGLLALVQGVASDDPDAGASAVADGEALGLTVEESLGFDASPVVPATHVTARSALFRWTGQGWFCLWESPGGSGTPTKVVVSEADDDYRLWWGYGNKFYTQRLRRSFYNPKQGVQIGTDRFADSGFLETGRFDAGMVNFPKASSHFEMFLDEVSEGVVTVSYRTDAQPAYAVLGEAMPAGTAETTGLYTWEFDPDGDGFGEGFSCRWIEFRFDLSTTDPSKSPVICWFAWKFVKIPLQTQSFSFTVPLTFPEEWSDRSGDEIRDHLNALASAEGFTTFKFNGDTYRVRLARTGGEDETGKEPAGQRQVNLIEMRTGV